MLLIRFTEVLSWGFIHVTSNSESPLGTFLGCCFLGLHQVKRAMTILSITLLPKRTFTVTNPSISIIHLWLLKDDFSLPERNLKSITALFTEENKKQQGCFGTNISSRAYINKYSSMFSFVGEQVFSKHYTFQKPWQNKMLQELYTYQKTTTTIILLLGTGDNLIILLFTFQCCFILQQSQTTGFDLAKFMTKRNKSMFLKYCQLHFKTFDNIKFVY